MPLLVVGLGNPGHEYEQTVHNTGKLLIQDIVKKNNSPLYNDQGLNICKMDTLIFGTTSGYMNESGIAVQSFLSYYKHSHSLVIIQDDTDQTVSNAKLVQGGGSGGHRGIQSLIKHVPNWKEVWRLKIGVRKEGEVRKSIDFVLTPLSKDSLILVPHCSDLLLRVTKLLQAHHTAQAVELVATNQWL